ncbi:hypothetical protein B0H67DRAFT_564227 [Lasiosphaeris hirsuta]|uniref:Uncharacterized protein n=1 Tax=Lasiosphaeris hirsuta TaxID=260670 RepID=A0AA40E8X4_9PEZI|nr:hypothetical protein B0H67DRAFT_564227 [Lasiosphaeris hirsuta]
MQIIALLSAVAFVAGGVDAVRHNSSRRRMVPDNHSHRARYHQRMHSIPVAALEAETATSAATSTSSNNPVSWWGDATTMTVTLTHPSLAFINGTASASPVLFKTSLASLSCLPSVTTITQTVNVTVSFTASASIMPSITKHHSATVSLPPKSDITSCTSTKSLSSSFTQTDPCPDSASTTSYQTVDSSTARSGTTPCPTSAATAPPPPVDTQTTPRTLRFTLSTVTSTPGPSSGPGTAPSVPQLTSISCGVIDTALTPIIIGTLVTTSAPLSDTVVTSIPTPTGTVCVDSAPSGSPRPANVHCGVRGKAVGNYFLGRFVENAAGVGVTLEGRWKFCGSVWGATHGCLAYDFHLNEFGVPRCDLYGNHVAFVVDAIDNYQPNTWFDLECGDPTNPKWHPADTRPRRG